MLRQCLTILSCYLICFCFRTSLAGYGEVWQEMNWIYNNEDFFEKSENYQVTESGLKFAVLPNNKDDKKTKSKLNRGDKAEVIYKMYLEPLVEGGYTRHLYSQANLGKAFEVILGGGRVIKGFDEALYHMSVGDRGRFLLPPHLGYGSTGSPSFQIPGGSTLIYFIEVLGRTPKAQVYTRYGGRFENL